VNDQEHRPSLLVALSLAVVVGVLIVFTVPRIVAYAQTHSRYAPPAVEHPSVYRDDPVAERTHTG